MSVLAAREAVSGTRGNVSLALTLGLALFLLVNAFALNNVLRLVSPIYYSETVLNHTSDVLHAEGCDDSWGIMAHALRYAQSPHTTPLYTEIFFNQRLKFQYPPSSLFAIEGMLWLGGPELVRTSECPDFMPASLNDVLGWVFILMSAVSAAILLERGLRQTLPGPSSSALITARYLLVLGLALTFYPIVKAFTLGQIQLWLNGMLALSLLCWATNWKASSGVLVGLMCLVKPHYGLFVLWAAWRREWRFTLACVAAGSIGLVASIATFGWTDNLDYLQVFWFLSQHGEVYYPNQSFNGLLNRVMTLIDPDNYDSIGFDDNGFPPFNPWIYAGTVARLRFLHHGAECHHGVADRLGAPLRNYLSDLCRAARERDRPPHAAHIAGGELYGDQQLLPRRQSSGAHRVQRGAVLSPVCGADCADASAHRPPGLAAWPLAFWPGTGGGAGP
jgi:hypothetical protein